MIPKPGDKYKVICEFWAASGKHYDYGDVLELVEPTGQAPFNFQSAICNWIVKCPHFTPPAKECVWSSIWMLIEHRMIERVEKP